MELNDGSVNARSRTRISGESSVYNFSSWMHRFFCWPGVESPILAPCPAVSSTAGLSLFFMQASHKNKPDCLARHPPSANRKNLSDKTIRMHASQIGDEHRVFPRTDQTP